MTDADKDTLIDGLREEVCNLLVQVWGMEESKEIIRAALDLCPTCAGLPIDVVTRCAMCRKLWEAL